MATHPVHVTVEPALNRLMQKQRELQIRLLNGTAPFDLDDVTKMAYIREQALALMDEVHEALAETGWRSWATSNHINRPAFTSELGDAFIFLMNLMLVAGVTPSDLVHAVDAKIDKNQKRQDDKYDGVSTKCPGCRRAYDDDAVLCTDSTEFEMPYCVVVGSAFTR